MVAKRLLALLAAVALVAGAVAVRGLLTGDGSSAPATSAPAATSAPNEPAELVCVTELLEACRRLPGTDVRLVVEPAGVTARRLAGPDAVAPRAWVTLAPWPELVDRARARAGLAPLFDGTGVPLAATPLVVIERDRLITRSCSPFVWACVALQATERTVGFDDPRTSARGLAVFAAIAVARVGRAELSNADLQDPAFVGWFTRVSARNPTDAATASSVVARAVLQPGSFDAVGAFAAEAAAAIGRRTDLFTAATPTDRATAVAVAARPAGGADDPAVVTEALLASGWNPITGAPPAGPDAATMEALQQLWQGAP